MHNYLIIKLSDAHIIVISYIYFIFELDYLIEFVCCLLYVLHRQYA